MTISAISNYTANSYSKQQEDFKALAAAINSGSATQAQQALNTLQSDWQSSQTTSSGSSQTTSSASAQTSQGVSTLGAQIKTDFSTLVSAVQNGDMTGAQSALSNLKQDFSSAGQSASGDTGQAQQTHHHHHHHGGGGESASSTTSTSTSTPSSTSSDQTTSAVGANSTVASVLAAYTNNSPQAS